ncbi:uncharacterized protein LOC125956451 [Anopheles darlingi]|uniref:uncharacterized protein LOC125956451 n=1 Tax=Anopheles darlingi TaxID=43151 RepID=UPI002100297A|nr:uncharacterized protein LOC125956451 [Anopheles darlingi]XP_049544295.1 uncharacterized protein LOC125956451 [Anopheles darlingi]
MDMDMIKTDPLELEISMDCDRHLEMDSDHTITLIELVKQYPVLYDTSHPKFKYNEKKGEAWEHISASLNVDSEILKTRWRSLRDTFIRRKKEPKRWKKWRWSDRLAFLENTYHPEPRTRTKPTVVDIEPVFEAPAPTFVQATTPTFLSTPTPTKITPKIEKSVSKGEKPVSGSRQNEISDVDKVLGFLSKKEKKDSSDLLFTHYASLFKTLDRDLQADLKIQLANMFVKAELEQQKRDEGIVGSE